MTVLTDLQDVAPFIGLAIPDAVMSSTTREHVELKAVTNYMADKIAKAHPWQKFSTLETVTGDGTTEAFDLPADYEWMPDTSQVWSSVSRNPLAKVPNTNEWLGMITQDFDPTPGMWIIYGDQIHIRTVLGATETAKFFYQSNTIIRPATGSDKSAFTLDTDTFRLSSQLLKLGVIYRWKQLKGQDYGEEMADFEDLKEKLIARDKGATILKQGSSRIAKGTTLAFPGNVPTS